MICIRPNTKLIIYTLQHCRVGARRITVLATVESGLIETRPGMNKKNTLKIAGLIDLRAIFILQNLAENRRISRSCGGQKSPFAVTGR